MRQRRYFLACIRNAGMVRTWYGETTFWENVFMNKAVIRMLSANTPITIHKGYDINETIDKPP